MSVRISLEIGHEAAIRTKLTQEGFTHDWEVFVRGCDGASIHYYVEKVVFYLHETFPKPRRVVKEPPYSVKESGYAGFTLPIEVYLRNKDEPKKITFNYDLNLQPTGPPLIKVQKEKYVFNMPNEDFKFKLLKGGGMTVNSMNSQETSREHRPIQEEKPQLVSKPRLGGSDCIKKHKPKIEEPRLSHSFRDLFGTPFTKTSKAYVDSKPIPKDKNSNISKPSSSEKDKSKKHSPHKEKDKEKEKFREKNEEKQKIKDEKKREEKKERNKEQEIKSKEKKERRDKSPKMRSPTPTKRPPSPKRLQSPSPKYKEKEERRLEIPKEKKSLEGKEKSEKKSKKDKRDKEKDKKESKHKEKDLQKIMEQRDNKNIVREKEKHKEHIREPELISSPLKLDKKEKSIKEKEIIKEFIKEKEPEPHIDKNGKIKTDKLEEKPKHKHKKKDKDKRDKDKSMEKEKQHKLDKRIDKPPTELKYLDIKELSKENDKSNSFNSPRPSSVIENKSEKSKKPLNALLAEFVDGDSSNSSTSSHEVSFVEPKVDVKKDTLFESIPKVDLEKPKAKKEKSKKNKEKRAEKDGEKKRKRKSENNRIEEPLEKVSKEESSNSNSKDSDVEINNSVQQTLVQTENEENYEDYMNILRDLQHKILSLQDNSELQRVVQLIAETGRFEVSAQTFDFDLCLLERSTIIQLQKFFQSTS